MTNPKIIFMGTSQFAVPILENLIKNKYRIIKTISQPDRPAGRQQKLTRPPLKQIALKYQLPLDQPEKLADQIPSIRKSRPDLIIVAAYGQIIPKAVLEIPRLGVLNLHPSLLPKYRGASPIQTAILNGDKKTGITIIKMDEQIDHGPIIAQKAMTISSEDNYRTLEKKLADLAADFLIEILPQYLEGKIQPRPQDETKASYTKLLTRADGRINWQKSAREIERIVQAFYPWPGAWTEFKGLRVKILKAKAITEKQKAALPAGKGFLLLELVQPAGKKPMSGLEFFRGHPDLSF